MFLNVQTKWTSVIAKMITTSETTHNMAVCQLSSCGQSVQMVSICGYTKLFQTIQTDNTGSNHIHYDTSFYIMARTGMSLNLKKDL